MLLESPHHEGQKYRADIDGLRAIAVLSVVGFHMGYASLSGGFVGVDVFFVISGYLITALIMRDIALGRFSITSFYERRIRRIFPAMFAMFFVVSILAWYLLLPSELVTFEQSLLAAVFSGSNFLFWHQAGYFDIGRFYKPLLHTWSLAVEEQFYLLFPPFLLLLRGTSSRRTKIAIFLATALSFATSLYFIAKDRTAAFYFAPLRAWELLLGGILSQRYLPQLRSSFTRNAASITGLLMILIPVHRYQEVTLFPGLAALPPCIGAALIIAAGEIGPSFVGRILSWKPVVFIGLISYSLYLWHWPVIVFQTTSWIFVPRSYADKHLIGPVVFLISIALAVLSWAFIERPFRMRSVCGTRQSLFTTAAITVAAFSAVAIGLILLHGVPGRYSPDINRVADYLDEPTTIPWRKEVCFIQSDSSFTSYRSDLCLATHPGKPSLLLLGDSHAASLYPGLLTAFPEYDILQANASGCRPLLHEPSTQTSTCRQLFNFIFNGYLLHHHVDTLLLAGRWYPADFAALGDTIAWAQARGIHIVLVGKNVEFDAPLPRLLAIALRDHTQEHLVLGDMTTEPAHTDREMKDLALNKWHVPYISFFDTLCKTECPLYIEPLAPIVSDAAHLTLPASAAYAKVIRTQIAPPQ